MKKIILIGSGNVAWHLGHALFEVGHQIVEVISKTNKNAKLLAKKLNTNWQTDLSKIKQADFAIIAVNDDAIMQVVEELKDIPFAHTSGSMTISKAGVFYPLQTFSKKIPLKIKEIPFCISADNKDLEVLLFDVAKSISNKVFLINQKQRESLHLAAVFASNFTNQMYIIAEDIINEQGLNFDILKPLITETAYKILENSPKNTQTGPAKRRDLKILEKQLAAMRDDDIKSIYSLITSKILKQN